LEIETVLGSTFKNYFVVQKVEKKTTVKKPGKDKK
jgi:hypothetical protein